MYEKYVKRLLDVILSSIGIILLLPLWLLIALAIKLDDSGPVLFRQKRIGMDSKMGEKTFFTIDKFRTMKMSTPSAVPTHKLENPNQYLTRVGRILRKTSLDELPQMINILKGDISVVGPRPALWNQDDLYEERAKYGTNAIKPGLTGLAQISGRDELEIHEKAALDGEYSANISFGLDVRCLIGTITTVFRGRGIVEGGTGELRKRTSTDNDPRNR